MRRISLVLVAVIASSFAVPQGANRAAAAGLEPGDIVVADQGVPAIIRVDPTTGAQTILSSGGLLPTPRGIAITSNGDVLVAVRFGSINGIVRVDPKISNGLPGNQTVVSSGGSFVAPADLLVEAGGDLLVADFFGGVIKVDPVTGAQTVVSSGGSFTAISGIAIDAGGDILVADFDAFNVGPGQVIRVDPITGAQTVVSSGGNFLNPAGIAVEADGGILVPNQNLGPGPNGIVRVDPVTGGQTVLFSSGSILPGAIAIDASGDIIVADFFDGVIKVDPLTGVSTPVSSGGFFGTPAGIEVVPVPPSGCPVAMDVSFNPRTLNPRSNGRWVTVYLEPPAGHSVSDIDVVSVRLNGVVAVASGAPTAIGDHDEDGLPDLALKFSQSAVQGILPAGNAVTITVRGLIGSECFEGTTVIRVGNLALAPPEAGSVPTAHAQDEVRLDPSQGKGSLTLAIGGIAPNPARREFRVRFSLPTGNPAKLVLYDLSGREVARREVGELGAGQRSVVLGRRQTLPAGVYLVRLTQDRQSVTARAIVVQ